MKRNFIYSKKSVRTLLLKLEPYFLSHAERGESLQNQDFVGGMQNRRRFAPTIFLVLKPFSKNCGGYRTRTCKGFLPLVFKTSSIPLGEPSIFRLPRAELASSWKLTASHSQGALVHDCEIRKLANLLYFTRLCVIMAMILSHRNY